MAIVAMGLVNCVAGRVIWQDEIGGVAAANMPMSELWSLLPFQSFPPLFLIGLKFMFYLGIPQTAFSLRIVGFCIWIALLSVLWGSLRQQKGFPLVSLALFASVPAMIRHGQAIRAYGLAVIFGIALIGYTWEYVRKPSWRNYALSALFGLLGTHCLYQSSFLLACVCLSAAVIVCMRRSWGRLAGVMAIGVPAAMTVPIYFPTISKAAVNFHTVADVAVGPKELLQGFVKTLSSYTPAPVLWWLGLLFVSIAAAVCLLRRHLTSGEKDSAEISRSSRELAVFSLITGISFTGASTFVLWRTGAVVEPWHLLLWVGVTAALADKVFDTAKPLMSVKVRVAILTLVVLAVVGNLRTGWSMLDRNYSTMDVIAQALETRASSKDLILVHPWAYGVSFNYYYHGPTTWVTVPPLADHRVHRLDLLGAAIGQTEAVEPIERQIRQTIRDGHSVWLVGKLEDDEAIRAITPIGRSQRPWLRYWSARVSAALNEAGAIRNGVPLEFGQRASSFEGPPLSVARKTTLP